MTQGPTSNMTEAEVAAWESMIRDGTFWRVSRDDRYAYERELRRRAQKLGQK